MSLSEGAGLIHMKGLFEIPTPLQSSHLDMHNAYLISPREFFLVGISWSTSVGQLGRKHLVIIRSDNLFSVYAL